MKVSNGSTMLAALVMHNSNFLDLIFVNLLVLLVLAQFWFNPINRRISMGVCPKFLKIREDIFWRMLTGT